MKTRLLPWVAAWLVLAAGLCLAAARWPRFPGDVAVTRAVQAAFPGERAWAKRLTDTAKPPASHVLLAAAVLAGWRFARGRGAIAALAAFAAAHALDRVLKPLVARPRPAAELVEVAGSTAGYSCPSTFALVSAATLGFIAVTAWRGRRDAFHRGLAAACLALLAAGGLARVVLGGHWASDILISWVLMGGVLAALVLAAGRARGAQDAGGGAGAGRQTL
jgi:membrane-associated phospholipid phosphatase